MLGEENISPIQSNDNVISFSTVIQKVFSMMTVGLIVTAVTSLIVLNVPSILLMVANTMWIWLIAEVLLVIFLSMGVNKMGPGTCTLSFFAYSIVNGITLTPIFLIYTEASIATTFFIAASIFLAASLFGKITKCDLTRFSTFFFMGLIGLILASIVELFIFNDIFSLIVSAVGVILFIGITAYDVQKIKQISEIVGTSNNDDVKKVVTMGALTLYLDFINIFLKLLRFLGKRRND